MSESSEQDTAPQEAEEPTDGTSEGAGEHPPTADDSVATEDLGGAPTRDEPPTEDLENAPGDAPTEDVEPPNASQELPTEDVRMPLDPREAAQREVESFLGPDVRTPVGIPRDYRPKESSITPLFRVEIGDFAGPLDLLLYLIRKHELDIFDIPITFITEKYLEMLKRLRDLEIDLAAEFLVIAAELTHIKSKMLLPAREGVAVDDDDEELGDPRAELVRRLLEYQKYQDAADQLADRDRLGRDVFARVPPKLEAADDLDPGLKSVSIFKLVELMAKLMKKAPPTRHEISFEEFSLADRIQYVAEFGRTRDRRFMLVQLLQGIRSRQELVVTFIAVLEMTKLGFLRILIAEGENTTHEDLPDIWVHMTGKELAGEVIDDYR